MKKVGADGDPDRYLTGSIWQYADEWIEYIKLGGTAEAQAFVPFRRDKSFFYFI